MWRSFAETFRDCGRDATLFVVVVIVLAAAAFASGELCLWAAVGLLGAAVLRIVCLAVRKPRQWHYAKLPPLSQNEWRAARSKLTAPQDLTSRWLLSKSGRIEYRTGPLPARRGL